jgi:hypothetical protein
MASEINWRHTATTDTLYATIRTNNGSYWNTSGTPALEPLSVAQWANYDIAMSLTEAGSYFYIATWPAGLTTQGWYWIDIFKQAGAGPAISDVMQGTIIGFWNGTDLVSWGANVEQWAGTAVHAATVAGVPIVQLHASGGGGGINAPANFEDLNITDTTGLVSANITQIMGSALAAKVLAAANYAYQDDGVIVLDLSACDTDAERGIALDAAITAVQALTPGGNAISSTNRACLLIPPGHYNVAALEPTISVSGVDLVALKPQMGGRRQYADTNDITCFRPPGTLIYTSDVDSHALVQAAADIQLRGFGIAQLDESGVVEKLYRSALYVAVDANDESVYDQMYFWSTLFEQSTYSPVGFQKHVGGTWTQCIANSNAWRVYTDGASAIFRARMEDCEGGSGAFIGDNTDFSCSASGCHLVRCRAIGGLADHSGDYAFGGCTSWGTAIDSTCYFEDCEAGNNAFAFGQTCAGTFIRCRAGRNSFGADSGGKDGVFSGHAVECIAGCASFGGGTHPDQGTMSGVLERCAILGNNQPLRLSGGVIKDCLIQTTTTDRDCVKLLDSTSKITGTTLIALGTGKAINAASALSFYGARNHYVGGLGTNVTNSGVADEVTPTTAAVATIQSGLATTANQTTILDRLGAWTGSGVNTVLGAFKALLSKTASAPSDIGGTFTPATDSVEAVQEAVAAKPTAADVKTAMEADGGKLDHLWETTEDNAGVRRFTENALEQAPAAGGDTVNVTIECEEVTVE